jgi:hypothetical protein
MTFQRPLQVSSLPIPDLYRQILARCGKTCKYEMESESGDLLSVYRESMSSRVSGKPINVPWFRREVADAGLLVEDFLKARFGG